MRFLIVLTLVLLGGCGSTMTLEQLEAQALLTGDWSAVEKRERIIARRNLRSGIKCPPGQTGYCVTHISTRCACVKSESIRALLAGYSH